MAIVELVVTRVAQRTGNGYLPGGMLSRRTVTVSKARYQLGLVLSEGSCSIERINNTQLKLAVCQDGEWVWYFFGPAKYSPDGYMTEFLPEALWLIQSDFRGPAMCMPQAQIAAFPGSRLPTKAAA